MGYNDCYGEIGNTNKKEHEYISDIMHFLNSTFSKTSTYKYAFFKSILDNLFNVNDKLELSFDYLSKTFSIIYWNIVCKYNLPQYQGKEGKSLIEYEIEKINDKYKETKCISFESLKDDVATEYLRNTEKIISIHVVGALYSDLNNSIYGFSKKDKKIWFSKSSYNFLVNYKSALEKLNYYGWMSWIERNLELSGCEISNISTKLDESTKRENLKRFKDDLIKNGDDLVCFYCGKQLKTNSYHLDHFIPWSFTKSDSLWNFVFSCSHCNTSKNNKIPNYEFLKKIILRNKKIFEDSYEEKLTMMYNSSLFNGFIPWSKKYE